MSKCFKVFFCFPVIPQRPIISIEDADVDDLLAGSEVQLRCGSTEGNPPPEVRWIRDNIVIDSTEYSVTSPEEPFGETISVLPWTLTRDDHGATFMCEVENSASMGSTVDRIFTLQVKCK